jgi:aerobic carbon-monoxide dehydrogenase large subunit
VTVDGGGYIGKSVKRPQALRHLAGRGVFTDDVKFPRLVHAAFVRSPYAHARVVAIDTTAAAALAGVVAVVTGRDVAPFCVPWVGTLAHLKGMKAAPQHPLALDKAVWQGEPVVAVVAESRALAEDGVSRVAVEWQPLGAVVDPEAALRADSPVIHPELGDNLAYESELRAGDTDAAFAAADVVIAETFTTGRHTAVSLEPRTIIADFEPAERRLTVHQSSQTPNIMQDILSRHLRLPEGSVRVVVKDVGGSFGLKLHAYPDEIATCILSIMLGRPVKFLADRIESFQTDIHARGHRVRAELAARRDGTILGMRVDDVTGIGPFSVYPRSSAVEGNHVIRLMPAVYRFAHYRARLRVVYQNKTPMCQLRSVGHPVAYMVMESMVDRLARELGLDPVDVRRRNMVTADMYPYTSPNGDFFERLTHEEALAHILEMSRYRALCEERDRLRTTGVYRGLGLCTFLETTTPGLAGYAIGGARISSQEGCTVKLDPSGMVSVLSGVTEQGQGTETMLAQVVATAVGVAFESVRVFTGDTMATPYGGGTWASRGTGVGGEAALQAARALKSSILRIAEALFDVDRATLDVRDGAVVDAVTGAVKLPLAEIGRIAHFRPDLLPKDFQPELTVTRHYVPRHQPFAFANGVQLAHVEVDVETGFVRLLHHWIVEDCGRIVNPALVDAQLRGAVVQGLGAALYEECVYDEQGQLLTTTMADYLVPMAADMPDIDTGHIETPTAFSEGGFKGVGEGGVSGAPGAVLNAVNDALAPFGARVRGVPITPERVLAALGTL